MKVSKVVLIVVALHVLVIGGIFVFEGCSRTNKAPAPDMAADESHPGQPSADASGVPQPQPVAAIAPSAMTPAAPATMAAATAAAPAVAPAARTYSVKKGDTLWKIAKNEGTSIGELARANSLTKTSTLKVGQKLQIPSKTQSTTTAAASVIPTTTDASAPASATTATADASGASYTVKSGDSLWKIARQQNVSVAAIKQANNLTSESLKIGQKLHIPAAAATAAAATPAGASPTVMSAGMANASYTEWKEPGTYNENGQTIHIMDFNETLGVVAKKYGLKLDTLMKANNIADATKVQPGQRIVIPSQTAAAPTVTTSATAPASSASPIVSGPVTVQ